jgi:hypothetical protein
MHSQMTFRKAGAFFLLFLFVFVPVVFGGRVVALMDERSQKQNIDEYVVLLRENVRQQRPQITGAMMALTPEESKKFWPIYDEFLASLNKINDARIQNLKSYAANYGQMTDEKTDEVMKQELSLRKQREDLLAQFYGRFKPLGSETAARFMLIESQIEHIADLQLDSILPTGQTGQ